MTFTAGKLEEALQNVDPMSEDELARTMRLLSRRSWEAANDLRKIVGELGEANANAEHTYNKAMIDSQVDHPDRRVDHHKAVANLASEGHKAEVFALTHMERALHREIEILDRLITSCQTQWKHLVGDETPFDQARRAS